jgi:hypothetical protein
MITCARFGRESCIAEVFAAGSYCSGCKRYIGVWNDITAANREAAIFLKFPIPTNASDRLTEKRFLSLGGTLSQWTVLVPVRDQILTDWGIRKPEQDFQAQFLSVFHIELPKTTVNEEADDEDYSAAAFGFDNSRNVGETVIKPFKPKRAAVLALAQKQGNRCAVCNRSFGMNVRKKNGWPYPLTPWFEHWIPQNWFERMGKSVAEMNQNTLNPLNCVTCDVCNSAKSTAMKNSKEGTPLSMDEVRKVSAFAWGKYHEASRQEIVEFMSQQYGFQMVEQEVAC